MKPTNSQGPIRRGDDSDLRGAAQAAIGILMLALGIMTWDNRSERHPATMVRITPSQNQSEMSKDLDRVNRHMQMTERELALRAQTRAVENEEMAPEIVEGQRQAEVIRSTPNHFESEDKAGQVYRDLNPRGERYDNPYLPQDRINAIIEQNQWLDQYNREQSESYVKAVKDNARAAGFDLQIDERYRVVNVRRVPNSVTSSPKGAPAPK